MLCVARVAECDEWRCVDEDQDCAVLSLRAIARRAACRS
jgi:hypothetical protein